MRMRKILLCLCILQLSSSTRIVENYVALARQGARRKRRYWPESERPPRPGQRKVIRIQNVSTPTLGLSSPKPNGAAVVICLGGGYRLAWDLEGTEVAEWLNMGHSCRRKCVPRRKDREKHDALYRMPNAHWASSASRQGVGY